MRDILITAFDSKKEPNRLKRTLGIMIWFWGTFFICLCLTVGILYAMPDSIIESGFSNELPPLESSEGE